MVNLLNMSSLLQRAIIILAVAAIVSMSGMNSAALGQDQPSSAVLIDKAWSSHGDRDVENTLKYTQQVIDLYRDEADKLQANLSALPKHKSEIEAVQVLNDVATAYFIQAEMYMRQQDIDKAIKIFTLIIEKYPYAHSWDQRGWFWSIAGASRQSIQKLKSGSIELEAKPRLLGPATKIVLYDPGKEDFVDYARYGEFQNAGTADYKYIVKDQEGLSVAVGEGIYPNSTSLRWDPEFKKAQKEKRLGVFAKDEEWDFLFTPDLQAAFFKWALAPQPQAVRLYYEGLILEKAGLMKHAIKCYYAIVVHFPGSYGITYFKTPWYVGQAALTRIEVLLRRNPQFGYRLEGADIKIVNGYDKDVSNDIVYTNPGKFVKVKMLDQLKPKPNRDLLSVKARSGKGRVQVLQYETGDWELRVDDRPYTIKGITYAPSRVGESPDDGTLQNWMDQDLNTNGKADGPYDAFVDKNKNNKQDKDEPAVGDFALMKDMGVNTIRLYHHPLPVKKEVLRDLYKNFGIMTIMGDFLGKYTLGSGAKWNPGTDYNNEEHKKNMMDSVLSMVNEYKDEPFILFWILGNENVYGYACNADKDPDAFFKFANEVARKIKEIDPDHPVAICSGDILFLDRFGKNAPDVDIFGANAYRGNLGFGYFWRQVKDVAGKPAFITEYGCSSHYEGKSADEGEYSQADYHQGSWEDIMQNGAFSGGAGNSIGGVAFEWLDEWWKGYEPALHDKKSLWKGPFPDGTMHEEWLGLCSQGDGTLSPFLRHIRKAYHTYKKLWR
jgi:tetratricopeptide (TPR) repeat protein